GHLMGNFDRCRNSAPPPAACIALDHTSLGKGTDDLSDRQRSALRLGENRLCKILIREELGDRRGGKPRERQAEQIRGEARQMVKEGSDHPVRRDLLGSVGKKEAQRRAATRNLAQQTEAGRIGPLQIVDEQDGPLGGERLQQSHTSLEGQSSTALGIGGRASYWP